jgi:molybdopterin molybdotransferase
MRYAEALNILREIPLKIESEEISVELALGRVMSEDVVTSMTLPPFTNSAVDGFAIAHSGTVFRIAGTLFPGETPRESTPPGHAFEIMTGAPIPKDCFACAKIEDVIVETALGPVENARFVPGSLGVKLKSPLRRDENLRFAGTDYAPGTRIVSRGDRLRASHLMALVSNGITRIKVYKRPRVLLISTGKEIVEPGHQLKPGEIYNSTRIYLQNTLESFGCSVEIAPTMADDTQVFLSFVRGVMKHPPDVIVTTGAVSMGSADFIRPALEELGAKVLFHRVDIRPGRPILFAKLENTVVFGLPGNPVSGVVGARFFIEPFLRSILGRSVEKPFTARLAGDFKKPSDLRGFFKAQLEIVNGEARIHLLNGQPSYMVRPLLQSSVWAVLREDVSEFGVGDLVEVYTEEASSFAQVQGDV